MNLKNFIKISNELGSTSAFIQGGGGNTSLKISTNEMYIKSSGSKLKEMNENHGFCKIDYTKIINLLNNPVSNKSDYENILKKLSDTEFRPSIETGFHAILGRGVIHSHSVFLNVLLCSIEGKEISEKLFPQAIWCEYFSPGWDITLSIHNKINELNLDIDSTQVFFLQNHGVIFSCSDVSEALELHNEYNQKVLKNLKFTSYENYQAIDHDLPIIFPDQAVFSKSNKEPENIKAAEYIFEMIHNNGLQPKTLTEQNIEDILGLDSEQYRISLHGNNLS